MAIMIREYLGHNGLKVDWSGSVTESASLTEAAGLDPVAPDSLMVDIEGIHVGLTRNFTYYTESALKGSIPTWTRPYQRPLIMHHNEKDGRIIGRVKHVDYTDKNTRSDTGALVFTANVPDKEGKEGIQNGTLKTVSIGAIVHDARCSVCGQNIAEEGPCEHERGVKYDEKLCYWIINSMEAKELSYVIVPSDVYAHNIQYYKPQESDLKESKPKGVLDLAEAANMDPVTVEEGTVVEETGDKTAEQATSVEEKPVENNELEDKVAKLETEKKELEDKVAKLEEEKATAAAELESAKATIEQTKKSLETAQTTLAAKESSITAANSLREAAETEVIEIRKELKEALVEKVSIMRNVLGKPVIESEELSKRSQESLKDSLIDLKEEFNGPTDVTKITQPQIPTVIEKTEESGTATVKESKNKSNIDLAEGLENIFSSLLSKR